jgi:t-SNARE complex subunit (syntaxin)
MTDNNRENNLEKIRAQIELLKARINNMDRTLILQEKTIDLIDKKSRDLLKETQFSNTNTSVEQIMKNAFKSKALPKILHS